MYLTTVRKKSLKIRCAPIWALNWTPVKQSHLRGIGCFGIPIEIINGKIDNENSRPYPESSAKTTTEQTRYVLPEAATRIQATSGI